MPAPRTDGSGGGYQVDAVEAGGTDFRLLDITQIYPLVMLEDTAGMRDAAAAWQNLGGQLDAEARALRGSLTGLAGAWRSAAATEFGERGEAAATSLDLWSAIAAERAGELFDLAVVVAGKKLRMQWIWDDFARAAREIADRPSGGPSLDPEAAALTDLVSSWLDAGDLEDNVRRYTQQALDEVVNPLANRFAESALLFAASGPVFAGPTDAAVPGDALLAAIMTGAWVPEGVSFPGSPAAPAVLARTAPPVAAPVVPHPGAAPVLAADLPPGLAPVVLPVPVAGRSSGPAMGLPPVPAADLPPVPVLALPLVPAMDFPPVPIRALPPVPAMDFPPGPVLAHPPVPVLAHPPVPVLAHRPVPASILGPEQVSMSAAAPALRSVPATAGLASALTPPPSPVLGRLPSALAPGVPSLSAAAGRTGTPAPSADGWGGTPTLAGRRASTAPGGGLPTGPGAHPASSVDPATTPGRSLPGTHRGAVPGRPGSPSGRTALPPQLPGRTRTAAQEPTAPNPPPPMPSGSACRPGTSVGDLLGRSAPTPTAAPAPPPALGSRPAPARRGGGRTTQPGVALGARHRGQDFDTPGAVRPERGSAPSRQQVPGQPSLGSVARAAGGSPTPTARVVAPSRVTAPSPAEERATDRARRRAEWAASRHHHAAAGTRSG